MQLALLEDWGAMNCAVATTVSHDSHNLTVFGQSPRDMALAANAVIAEQGGLSVAASGRVLKTVALPMAGILSVRDLDNIAEGFTEWAKAVDSVTDWAPPYFVLKALFGASLVCNPGPRLSDQGIVEPFETREPAEPMG